VAAEAPSTCTQADVVLTRTFDAPPELVFRAWTDPDMVQEWWGCAQATKVTSTVDLRVGGAFRHVMQVAGCGQCTAAGAFTEVAPPRRLVFELQGGGEEGVPQMPPTLNIVDFIPRAGKTELRLTVCGLAGTPYKDIITAGWRAGLAKLAEIVQEPRQ
jgi:uncharacterized protein YndB with AHSA1/START domain